MAKVDELNELRTILKRHMRQYASKEMTHPIPSFVSWAVSQQCEEALTHETPVVMTTQKSRSGLNQKYGKRIVDLSLSSWSALNKAVEREYEFKYGDTREIPV